MYITEFVRELDGRLILHTWQVYGVEASVRSGDSVPDSPGLIQNFPNPFNSSTRIRFHLTRNVHVTLKIRNLQGQIALILLDAPCKAGEHEVIFDAAGLTSGIYILTIESGTVTGTRKMVLIR